MARKTKAELEEQRQAQAAKFLAERMEAYPTELLNTLEMACKLGRELVVRDAMFVVREYNQRETFELMPVYSEDSWDRLAELLWDLRAEQIRRDEEQRKYEAKQTALAKLTKEERELLGL